MDFRFLHCPQNFSRPAIRSPRISPIKSTRKIPPTLIRFSADTPDPDPSSVYWKNMQMYRVSQQVLDSDIAKNSHQTEESTKRFMKVCLHSSNADHPSIWRTFRANSRFYIIRNLLGHPVYRYIISKYKYLPCKFLLHVHFPTIFSWGFECILARWVWWLHYWLGLLEVNLKPRQSCKKV